MWSIGVITHALICGSLPFDDPDRDELIRMTRFEPLEFKDPVWNETSSACKDFVDRLLIKSPDDRITLDQTLNHDWFEKVRPKYQ